MTHIQNHGDEMSEAEKAHKIEMLRQMMLNAEKTMQSAKAMLLQLEGKKKPGRRRKVEDDGEGSVVEGTFDGQIMIGIDGKQYPVPANYASKSKLVEGDMLKLTITPDGSFVYKQIGPANRRSVIGIVSQDEKGNYVILAEGKPYKVLLASVTYFKAEPGDEVVIMIPRDIEATWAAIENVLSKGGENAMHFAMPTPPAPQAPKRFSNDGKLNSWKEDLQTTEDAPRTSTPYIQDDFGDEEIDVHPNKLASQTIQDDVEDEWTSDIADLEREIQKQQI